MKKHLSVRYGTIQGCYWMGYAALMGVCQRLSS